MKINSRVLRFPILLAIPFFLGGCAQDGSTLSALRENPILQNAARAVLMGKTFDRAAIARRNNDDEALVAAADDLGKIDPLSAAEQLVTVAAQLDGRAQITKDEPQKKLLEAQAAEKYREALRIAPEFPSRNAMLLNALGYFLAERGQTKSDFQTGEQLTRSSLKLWDASVSEVENAPMSGQLLAARKFMRANTRDSLAWALFRQGKLQNAKAEQIIAVKEAKEFASQVGEKVPADLYFHLGEIERALKNLGAAKSNYEEALKVEPDHAPSRRALNSLSKKPTPDRLPSENKPPADSLPDESAPGLIIPDGTLQARSTPAQATNHEL